jgi:Phage tail tube protein, TTP
MGFKSEAVSSQGTELAVQGAPGAPVVATITAISKAAAAVITAANTFINGQIVEIADVVGMVEINGQSGVVADASGTGFTLTGVNSLGFTDYESGGTATGNGATFENVCEARNFTGFDGQASEIDVTTMCSTAMEYVPGLQDFGAFNFTMNYVPSDPAQKIMQDAKASGDTLWWKLMLPNDNEGNPMGMWLFQAFVRQMTLAGGVNAALESNVVLRITGEPTFVEG